MGVCYRCGDCCRNYFCIVPKDENSNLSDEYLNWLAKKEGYDVVNKYVEDNHIPQGEKCKWLDQDNFVKLGQKNDIAICTAYDRRSSMCRNHMDDDHCNIGLITWKQHQDKGNEIPESILKLLKEHPLYNSVFKEGDKK